MKTLYLRWFIISALMLGAVDTAFAQCMAFTYHGRLNDNGGPANGSYDLTFSVFDAPNVGNQLGCTLTNTPVGVTNGLFTAMLDFGTGIFSGPDRWLEMGVRSNGVGDFTTLNPRQRLTPTPYAIMSNTASNLLGKLPAGQLSGTLPSTVLGGAYLGSVTFNNPANSFAGSGAGLTGVNAARLGGHRAWNFWQLGGNVGTLAGVNFLGTVDNLPLEFKVNGQRAFRLEPTTNSPNVIGGFEGNYVSNAVGVTISGGGAANRINAVSPYSILGNYEWEPNFGTIGGGAANRINASSYATIPGGVGNSIVEIHHSLGGTNTIGGGAVNYLEHCESSTIAGGEGNQMIGFYDGVYASTIGGGRNNEMSGSGWPISNCTIAGGENNYLRRVGNATIGGGSANQIQAEANWATIAGGASNVVGGLASYGTVSGGTFNSVLGRYGTISGGDRNVAGERSLAAGRRAKATHLGTFVWSDSNDFDFTSTITNSFAVRSVGGARFVSSIDADGIPVAGVELVPGGGSWSSLSDRNAKENFAAISPREVLEQVNRMPITTWNYKSQDAAIRHIGPMAQDFAAAFQVGENDRRITTVDADGVALAAIQGLNQKLEEKEAEIHSLRKRLEVLERAILGRETVPNEGPQ